MGKLRHKEPKSLPEDLNLAVWLLNIAPPASLIHIDAVSGCKGVQGAEGVQSGRRQDCRKGKAGWCHWPTSGAVGPDVSAFKEAAGVFTSKHLIRCIIQG